VVLVDSNVIIDVLAEDPVWRQWSEAALSDAADSEEIAINPIIYAEIASGFATEAELNRHLNADAIRRLALPYEAAFVAGRAFVEYRRRGGVLLHRSPRCRGRPDAPDTRRETLPGLLPETAADFAGLILFSDPGAPGAKRYNAY
jgi:predicted nucleic acid-binding protein